MTNLVDSLQAPPRAEVAATSESGHSVVKPSHHKVEPCHPEVLRGVRSAVPFSPLTSDLHPPTSKRRALTLIEMLVALAVTLVMMAAVVNLFANMSASIRNRRAAIETGSQLRQVRNRLAMDLSGATCRGSTWQDPAENQGYIEIIEGKWSDKNPSGLLEDTNGDFLPDGIDATVSLVPGSQATRTDLGAVTDGRALGDYDDVLALTTQNESVPFTGKVPYYNTVSAAWESRFEESHQAEVIWFAEQNGAGGPGEPGMRRIYRRALLLRPDIQLPPLSELVGGTNLEKLENFNQRFDMSVRIEDGRLVGNTLADLNKREHRYFHNFDPTATNNGFPHAMLNLPNGTADWLVLNNTLAFDVRIYDEGAPLFESFGATLEPGDLGWEDAVAAGDPIVGYGAYCDLGWALQPGATPTLIYPTGVTAALPLGPNPLTWPSQVPTPKLHIPHRAGWHFRVPALTPFVDYPAVYDTWSYHYENDGLNQDSYQTATPYNTVFDQGANGLDDDNANGVDDRGERETAPPYDVPLRGVKVILRVYEPDARQIRESSVTHSFKQ